MAYIGKQPIVGNFVKLDAITATATTTFNLLNGGVAYFPQSANNCLVSLNGILQAPTDSYTISGSTIIFSNALTTSDVIDFIIVLGDVLNIGTPSDNTVSLAKLTATGTKSSSTFLRGDNTFAVPAGGANTPAFSAYRATSNQSITDNSDTTIQYNAELFDTDSCYNTSTYKFIPNVSGKYFINASILLNGGSNSTRFEFYIVKNGSIVKVFRQQGADGNPFSIKISGIVEANGTTDEITIQFYAFTGSLQVVFNTSGSFFEGYRLIGV
jgi:hypothetical protein